MDISSLRVTAEPAPDLEALFRRTNGWIGADGNYSVDLDEGRIAWLFSDTFVGRVESGKRVDTLMINNSIGIQKPGSEAVEFFYGSASDGSPKAFVAPDADEGYFWIFDGVQTSQGLYFFLPREIPLETDSGFPFKSVGMSLAHVPNPEDTPDRWTLSQCRFPYSMFTESGSIMLGSATLKLDGYVYVYGLDSFAREGGARTSNMIVARVPEDKFGDFDEWRFLSDGQWGTDWQRADRLFPGIATEFSVSYVPAIGQYAAVYVAYGISGVIVLRLSPTPVGPWSEPITVYNCPDRSWHEKAFCYSAKAHPELARSSNELIVTYAANSMNFPDLFEDGRLYWPRFVRVTVEKETN